MSFAINLDKYLTTPPDNGFESWFDEMTENFDEDFFHTNEDWVLNWEGLCDTWATKLFEQEYNPFHAAEIIERAFKVYKIKL